ncbi:hypothetical protein O0I10_003898 [Lichtheimia ornata]|uniref:RecF/RecN/SMC N-terminal domain-containing protein n=1 Tax=Lichtheimia ornata TaxID=688661 RepID=A0AAD7XZQ1_9FUNG|nr:uncharacterized protein O0I10_003898 [Lichtheimia ornata]KAJ8660440.1 hypothetical protein O0I10_003898 [Lichtheimia ornata]
MPPSVKRRLSSTEEIDGDSHSDTSVSNSQVARKKARLVNGNDQGEESSDTDYDEDEDLEIESQALSNAHSMSVARGMEVSEAGTISCVEIFNFMCHKHLKIELGPKINFIIGHNGSGKSAILTAITIALGAKANSTNRGKNLSSLIREGANAALAIVKLTNKGSDAYKADVYGDEIIIERKLLRDGGGQYKIKSSNNKTVSTKREELVAICDHMSIQIDNPLTVLSQDMARQFLNSSSSHDKYMLFMRGTQLLQLHEDYETIRESIETTRAIIDRKKGFLPELKKEANIAKEKYEEMLSARDIEADIEKAQNELVWRQIALKEEETEKKRKELQQYEDVMGQLEDRKIQAENKAKRQDEELQEAQRVAEEFQALGVPHLEDRQRLEQERAKLESDAQELVNDMGEINGQVRQAKARVEKHDSAIAQETAKQNSDSQAKRAQVQEKLDALKETLERKKEQRKACEKELEETNGKKRELDDDYDEARKNYDHHMRSMQEAKKQVEGLRMQRQNRLTAFGKNIPHLLQDIEREQRWQRKPVGPLGRYLKLKKPEFADVIEMVLNNFMSAFVVENFNDQKLLKALLRKHRMDWNTTIFVAKHDIFDFSASEPDEKYVTMMRALEFDNEWVKRQLVIVASIQQIILVHERRQGDEIMRNSGPKNVKTCFSKDCYKIGAKKGLRSEAMNKYNGPPRLTSDVGSAIERAENKLRAMNNQKAELDEAVRRADRKRQELRDTFRKLMNDRTRLDEEITRLSHQYRKLEESMKEEEPVNIQVHMSMRDDLLEKIKTLKGQYAGLVTQQSEIHTKIEAVAIKIEEYQVAEDEHDKELNEYKATIRSIEAMKATANQDVDKYEQKMARVRQRMDIAQKEFKHLENTLADWLNKAQLNFPDRVDTDESPDQLSRKIAHLQVRKREKEKSTGMSLEEAQEIAIQRHREYIDAEQTVRTMDGLTKRMKKALKARTERWLEMRKYIALTASGHFRYFMDKRGDDGILKFNHERQKLDMRVLTGDQNNKTGARRKDSKSLSGGEKSFSQVSLLLALWQGVSSPILCLDEFDVYMDAVNRKQSMKLMMDSACENSSQYILITPQDASNMVPGPYVTVHRLADPERRQE